MTHNRQRGRPPHDDILTPAEWRIVDAVRHGLTNRQIAERRGISIDGVKYHVANALQKLGFSNRKELRAWDGVVKGSALKGKESDMTGTTELGAVAQISRQVSDIEAARTWYGDRLGLAHLYSFGDIAFFDCAGLRLYLSQSDGDAADDSILYFRVADIHRVHEDLKSRGIDFLGAPHMVHKHDDGTEEWMAFFNDPDGKPLAIMAQHRSD